MKQNNLHDYERIDTGIESDVIIYYLRITQNIYASLNFDPFIYNFMAFDHCVFIRLFDTFVFTRLVDTLLHNIENYKCYKDTHDEDIFGEGKDIHYQGR